LSSSYNISILGSGWLGLPLAQQLSPTQLVCSYRNAQTKAKLEAANLPSAFVDIDDLAQADPEFFNSPLLIINIPSKSLSGFSALAKKIASSTIKRVIFVSSTSVYGPSADLIDETTPNNDSPLAGIEQLLAELKQPLTIVRAAGLIGPKRHPGKFFKNHRAPNPELPVNLIHRADVIGIIGALVNQSQTPNNQPDIYNAVAPTHPTRQVFYQQARQAIGAPALAFDGQTNQQNYKLVQSNKLTPELAYQFIYPDLLKLLEDLHAFSE
jgi:uncharacterized protein YbjT (DUF2867 family)